MINGRVLPWVQDSNSDGYPVWSNFSASQREVFIINYEGNIEISFDITPYNPSNSDDVISLTNLILSYRSDTDNCSLGEANLWGNCYSISNTDSLNLSDSELTGPIPDDLNELVNLEFLDLSGNSLEDSIPSFNNLTELKYLNLSGNNLSAAIPSSVGSLIQLSYLNLSQNNLSGSIPSAIGNLVNLDSLDLSYNVESILGNPISGIDTIPSQIGNLYNLRYLNLSFCYLRNFPNEISNLSSLEELNIAGNKWLHTIDWVSIGSDSASTIFNTIFSLSSLKKLNMVRSYMTGLLPPGISSLENLQVLDLSGNFLSGQLPDDFWQLENLKVFGAGSMIGEWAITIKNSFYGEILDSVISLSNLEILNINNNEFSGTIPEDIFDHPNIKQITFSNNLFTGSIPSDICNVLGSGDDIVWDPDLGQISGTFFTFDGNLFCSPYPECLVLDCSNGNPGIGGPPVFNCIGNQDTTNCNIVEYFGPVWYVSNLGSDENGNGSEGSPFASIQKGIELAMDGDTVIVESGIYSTNNAIYDKNIILGSRYLTTGDTSYISNTIIDGGGEGCPLMIYGNVNDSCRVTGLTIQNGTTGCVYGQGGGIYIEGSNPRLDNLIIKNNHSTNFGGGIHIVSSPTLDNIKIENNIADELGGGVYVADNANPVMINMEIINNSAIHGGGIYAADSSSSIINNSLIAENFAISIYPNYPNYPTEGYGGIEINNAVVELDKCTITNNIGGGIHLVNGSQLIMKNSIYWGSEPIVVAAGPNLDTNIFIASFSNIQYGWDGEGNIDLNPLFCSIESGDYKLAENSPCIGAGQNGVNIGKYEIGCTYMYDGPIWYVDNVSNFDIMDGSEDYPFRSIQQAIDHTNPNDTVLVAAGNYCGFDLKHRDLLISSHYILDHDELNVHETRIIQLDSCFYTNAGILISDVQSARLAGFTLDSTAIICERANITIDHIKIMNNHFDYGYGNEYQGAIVINESDVTLDSVYISDNYKETIIGGAAMIVMESNVQIKNSLIVNNTSETPHHNIDYKTGGIVAWNNSQVFIDQSTMYGNSGQFYGGVTPGALSLLSTSSAVINSSILWNNGPNQIWPLSALVSYSNIQGGWEGDGNINTNPLFCNFQNEDFNLAVSSPCNGTGQNGSNMGALGIGCDQPNNWNFSISQPIIQIDGGDDEWNPGESLSIEMEFCNNSSTGHMFYPGVILETDTNLVSISYDHFWFYGMDANSCNTVTFSITADSAIISDTLVTFSAYPEALNCENQPEYCIYGDTTIFHIQIEAQDDLSSQNSYIPEDFTLHQNHPNPFNPITTIEYDLPNDDFVNMAVYDMTGRLVKTLLNGSKSAGYNHVLWDATNDNNEPVSAGVYIYVIQFGNSIHTNKMILLK